MVPLPARGRQERDDGRFEIMDPHYFLNLVGQDQGPGPSRNRISEKEGSHRNLELFLGG